MTNKPIWLLDVDGVINDWRFEQQEGWIRFPTEVGFDITYDPTLMERLINLHNEEIVEIKWLTTWCHEANKLLREPLGFSEDLDVVGYYWYRKDVVSSRFPFPEDMWVPSEPLPPYKWWKLCAVSDLVRDNPHQRYIWTDDQIGDKETVNFLMNNRQIFPISPYPYLTHDEVTLVEEWIKQ